MKITVKTWKTIAYWFIYLEALLCFIFVNSKISGAFMDFCMAHFCLLGAYLWAQNKRTKSFLTRTFAFYALLTNLFWMIFPDGMGLAAGFCCFSATGYMHIKRIKPEWMFSHLKDAESEESDEEVQPAQSEDVPNENDTWEISDNFEPDARVAMWFVISCLMFWVTFAA